MVRHGMPIPAELSDAASERRKALVIGEPGPAREGSVRQLASAGYAVEQASPGFAAGAAVARFDPDVLVVLAPSPDGVEVAARRARSTASCRRCRWSASGVPRGSTRSARRAAPVALAAPLADAALADAVAGLLGAPRAARRGARDTHAAPRAGSAPRGLMRRPARRYAPPTARPR